MDTNILRSHDVNIGRVFTPSVWAEWLIARWGIFDAWIDGASVCDPTAGQGVFALALFRIAESRGIDISTELLSRLTLIDIHPPHLKTFRETALDEFKIDFPLSQLLTLDVTSIVSSAQYDILIGNPPWGNFANLPEFYKNKIRSRFVLEGLVPDRRRALLGVSRVDIASLITKIALGRMLREGGIGCFFLPLSLFSGDDAHKGFRDYVANRRHFSVEEVYEFTETKVFKGISTAYCSAKFRMDVRHEFPVRYFREINRRWTEHRAIPLDIRSDQWRILRQEDAGYPIRSFGINLSSRQKPRQGVNACGASAIFIFENKPLYLPGKFIFPLATKEIWNVQDMTPRRWILLPYNVNTGKHLSRSDIEEYPDLMRYLVQAKDELEQRKGILIQSFVNKGLWWSLLGVGPYSFAPYKVMWEAYGKHHFRPAILGSHDGQVWQANQAMHAYIPCWSESDAMRIGSVLRQTEISNILRQINGAGKRNWAQPGKIKKILFPRQNKPTSSDNLL